MKFIPPWISYALLGSIVLLIFWAGWYVNGLRWESVVAEQREAAQKLQAKLDDAQAKYEQERDGRLFAVDQSGVLKRRLQSAEAQVVIKEVIRYVQGPDAGICKLPDDWVRIHNAAAGVPDLPNAPAVDDGAPARVRTDSDALPVVAANYRACRESMTRLSALQDWLANIKPPEVAK